MATAAQLVDENGETVIHGAAYQNWPNLIRFLVTNGARADVWNSSNRWGWTPLIIAHGYREGVNGGEKSWRLAGEKCSALPEGMTRWSVAGSSLRGVCSLLRLCAGPA